VAEHEPTTRYGAWLVDLDGTLYRSLPVKLAMAVELSLFGWTSIRTLRAFRHAHEALRSQASPGEPTSASPFEQQLELTARQLGHERALVERTVREWMFERPLKWVGRAKRQSLLDELAHFRSHGGKTALVSDYPASGKLGALGAAALFDLVVSSGEPGGPRKLKPDPEGYSSAAARLGIEPGRCLVIGDRDDADGAAARSAGMGFRLIR
jgi:HAD superfamily hydrolase (TIGR01549 family)